MSSRRSTHLRRVIPAAICGFLLLAVSSCGSDWTTLNQPGSGFVVRLPGDVTCGSDRDETTRGSFSGHSCVAHLGRGFISLPPPAMFDVSWSVAPVGLDLEDAASVLRELATRGMPPGARTTEHAALLGGVQGTQYETVLSAGSEPQAQLMARARYAFHDGRLYRVGVRGAPSASSELAWRRVLRSFRFVAE